MMKRMTTLILILSLFTSVLKAPEFRVMYIAIPEEINYYTPLIKAVTWVEVKDGKILYNPKEEAVGWFQIRQCRVDHYNRLKGTNFVLTDFYDYELSRQMFLFFCKDRDYETIARAWCSGEAGTKKASDNYYLKIQKELNINQP